MIIELQNFGPIKSFKFDTSKDMHAIFGKNNIGKSYAISAVYLILKNLREVKNRNVIDDYLYQLKSEEIFKYYSFEKPVENLSIDIDEELTMFFNKTFVPILKTSFKNTFSDLQSINSKNTFNVILHFKVTTIKISNILKELCISNIKVNIKYTTSIIEGNIHFVKCDDFYTSDYGAFIRDKKQVLYICFDYFFKKSGIFEEPIYYLPASRSGLYNALNSFGAIFAELSKNRNFIRTKFEIPSIAEPISDYFLNLNTIDKAQANEHYLKHFEEIEQEILKGKITLDNETKKYYYVPTDTNMRLELSFTSSMISEIAPIIAHLKYIIPLESDKPSILFIEEPEAHLHPEIQILLLEYFVKLSKGNVKIVMTSHSNYIFNKLSNLLIANKIDKEKLSVSLMKMTPEGSVIEDGAMQIDEYGIEDNNFVDVAEQLYEERMSLLEKL
jgi:predicted ATPase